MRFLTFLKKIMNKIKNNHFEFELRIKRYYRFGFPFHSIEKKVNGEWHRVLDLSGLNYKLAKSIKKYLINNPNLITNPYTTAFQRGL